MSEQSRAPRHGASCCWPTRSSCFGKRTAPRLPTTSERPLLNGSGRNRPPPRRAEQPRPHKAPPLAGRRANSVSVGHCSNRPTGTVCLPRGRSGERCAATREVSKVWTHDRSFANGHANAAAKPLSVLGHLHERLGQRIVSRPGLDGERLGGRRVEGTVTGGNRRGAECTARRPSTARHPHRLWCLGRRFVAPRVGLEPTTLRLTAGCSAN
jgi:hypothetical protein